MKSILGKSRVQPTANENNNSVVSNRPTDRNAKGSSDFIRNNKVSQASSEMTASKNITIMLILTAFLYIIGNVPYSIYYTLLFAKRNRE